MSTSSYIIDSVLVLLVLLQVKEKKMGTKQLIRPLIILGIAVANYFTNIPTQGNDLLLIVSISAIGAAIGIASGVTAIMRKSQEGIVTIRSGWASACFWVLGMGSRFAFAYWASHGGVSSIASFSAGHQITSGAAWTDALLGMAVFEVVLRVAITGWRWKALEGRARLALA